MKKALFWLPSALVVAVIIYATLFPDPAGADDLPDIPGIDKLIHAIMFGGMAGALAFDYCRSRRLKRPSPKAMLICCTVSLIFGGVIELLQGAMALGRGADWFDFLADGVGTAVAFFTAPPTLERVLSKHKKGD